MNLFDVVREVRRLLEENGRVSQRMVRGQFGLDDAALVEVIEELVDVQRIAVREGGVLVWSGNPPVATAVPPKAMTPTDAASPSSRTPQSYTPKHLADRILQSRAALEGERKQVTVLFADVKGSMELAEQLDPEELHRILERFFAILTEGVHRFEGTVNQYTGDGIMALFGAPIAHEDHAQRACYAALHLREALREFGREIKRQHGIDFATRIGLNSGEVVVGRIGDDLRMDYTAQGHTVGLAQRMEALASGGSIYLSEHTAALVRGYFELDDLGAFTIKGASEPAQVFELRDIGALRSRFDLSRARGLSPFVGRDADMQTLEAALEQARAGNGQVVGIVAEAGTGKSRLCFEFLERCKVRGLTTQVGRALAHGKNIPLVPMLEVFRAYFGIADGDADRLVRDKIAGRLLLMDEQFRELLPVVFEFFGVPDPALPLPQVDADIRQRQLFAVLRKVVREERAEGQPVTLIEDLHWIDASSEAFLEQWVEAVAGSHALILLNFRPEYRAAWMNKSWYRQIPLAPLGPEAVRALLEDLLGKDASTAELTAAIHRRTGGNPFFTEEIVQSLIESGALVGSRGAYRLVTPIEQLRVPATVQALLAARIDRLGDREKQVLQAASVIGKDFSEPVLKRVVDEMNVAPTSNTDLQSALRQLKDGEFILEQALYPVAEYTFRHPLTQEVALQSQLQERRKRTHAAVARALEVACSDRLDESAALIAHHYDEAGEIDDAARWHRRAAEWVGLKDVQAAVRHWLRVRELARQMGDGPEASTLMLAACSGAMALGGWRLGGSVEEWSALFEEGCAAAGRAGDLRALATLTSGYGAVSEQINANASEAKRCYAEAVHIADRSGILSLRCGTRILHAISYFWTGPLAEAERLADELIALADGDPRIGAEVTGISPLLGARAWRAHGMGYARDPDEALGELHLLHQIALDSGFPEQALWAANFEAALRFELDRPDGLGVLAQTAARLAENRDIGATISSRTAIVSALASEGLWQTVLETAIDTLNLIRDSQALGLFRSFFLKHFSSAQLALGDLAAARAAAAEGVTHIRRAKGFWSPNSYAALVRAQLALHEPSADIAATLEEYAALLARTGFALFEGELHELGAQLAARDGQREKQIAALRLAHAGYVRFGMTARADRVQALIDVPDAVA